MGGFFKDNWGLSLARARQVLLYLVGEFKPNDAKKSGGGLSPTRWAAAGYGETDPVAGTPAQQTEDDRKKNRRVELVVQPNVEEMLNLQNIR
jgi:chemotaxis protein MotB